MPQGRKERPAAERGHRRKPAQSLAGVGIGSFYEYFSSKDDLAAVCIHLWIKEISTAMRASIEATRDRPLSERVESLILAQMSAPLQRPRDWAALFRLERRMSGMKEFRRMYGRFVRLHEEALLSGPGWPADAPPATSAFAVHAIVYGLVSQKLVVSDGSVDSDGLRDIVCAAVHSYLATVVPFYARPTVTPSGE